MATKWFIDMTRLGRLFTWLGKPLVFIHIDLLLVSDIFLNIPT